MSEHDTTTDTDTDAQRTEELRSWTESSGTGTVNIEDLTKVYGDGEDELVAVDGMDLHIEAERAMEQAEGRA